MRSLKILLFVFALYNFSACKTSKYDASKNPFKCGWYMPTMEDAQKFYDTKLAPFQLQANDTVANIGSGSGWQELVWLTVKDSITFYAEDIDTSCMRKEDVERATAYYSKLRGAPIKSKIEAVIGDEEHTRLPDNFFNKILIINTYHEFTKPEAMMHDIYAKLKPHGKLLVSDAVADKDGVKHATCGIPMKTEEEILREISSAGFKFQKIIFEGKSKSRHAKNKIYEFEKF